MANPDHLGILKQGPDVWNSWRSQMPSIIPDISGVDIMDYISRKEYIGHNLFSYNKRYPVLSRTNMQMVNLSGSNFQGTDFQFADFSKANLNKAKLCNTNLFEAKFIDANLVDADLSGSNLKKTNFSGSDLSGAIFENVSMIQTNFNSSTLVGCKVYGISAWDVNLEDSKQDGLIITQEGQPVITVDNIKVAQFIYMLLNNSELRTVIDTMTGKAVLILGRFGERKVILDTIADELRKRDYLPIMFDFDRPLDKTLTETVLTLAGLSKFVIAVMSDPNSVPWEVANISIFDIPIVPLIQEGQKVFPMFDDLKLKKCYIPPVEYKDTEHIKQLMEFQVLKVAEENYKELRRLKST